MKEILHNKPNYRLLHRPMKFWEVVSGFGRRRPDILEEVFNSERWRKDYLGTYLNFDNLVARQERKILDAPVPIELSREVAARYDMTYELIGNVLRECRSASNAEVLTALEVHDRFGGAVIEEIQEFGSCYVAENND